MQKCSGIELSAALARKSATVARPNQSSPKTSLSYTEMRVTASFPSPPTRERVAALGTRSMTLPSAPQTKKKGGLTRPAPFLANAIGPTSFDRFLPRGSASRISPGMCSKVWSRTSLQVPNLLKQQQIYLLSRCHDNTVKYFVIR